MTEPRATRLRDVYITACGAYLPGEPIDNEQMEEYLGLVAGKRSRMRRRILDSNGITSRHYALDREGRTTHLNEQLAANAALRALADRGLPLDDLRMLALGTTLGDSLLPGFASMVHGRLGAPPMEVLSAGGVCGSGMTALNAAYRALRSDTCANAVAGGSELVSRGLRASRYAEATSDKAVDFDAEFLRWMLSDGAGVVLLEQTPRPDRLSLRIDFIDLVSHAGETESCMHAGLGADGKAYAGKTWLDYPTIADAERAGLLRIRQDVRMLDRMVELGLQHWLRLMREGRIATDKLDHVVCHHSSRFFEDRFTRALIEAGALPQHGKWFTNLYSKGNTGAAAVFIALEELWRSGQLREGDRILLGVPESARFLTCIAHLTCVAGHAGVQPEPPPPATDLATSSPLPLRASDPQSGKGRLLVELAHVWADFERALARVPIVQRIERGTVTREDYRNLLLDLRQQVVDGARWIELAAANVSESLFWLRSRLLEHAGDEHGDFQLLESDFANVGGSLAVIRGAEKNVGSEALSAFIFHRAAQRDPIDLLGAMFVIEGLGARKAARWADQLAHALQLRADQIAFLRYHGARDDDHLGKLEDTIERLDLDDALIARVVKTARVVARLYALQLEHIELS
jgi:3-oxoacyl-[acyl-carrier-protein] synthase-3